MARILCAMSGGVDSSVAAAMLLAEGHEVVGAYMKNWINEEGIPGDCPWQQDIVDARAVAEALGIEFRVVNLREEYRARVVSYLLEGYESGITPNPDVMCNREMKFGVFLDYALEQGFEAVATGHYARTRRNADGTQDILCGVDGNKNQTYFLALLDQRQASHALFPIGGMTKPEVRAKAEAVGLPNAGKKDSQGICFIGEVKMSDFLTAFVDDKPGDIVGLDGRKLGEHRGLHLFTLGQRKGIGVPSNTPNEAYVVVEKRGASNELVIALDRPETPMLYATRCRVGGLSYVNREIEGEEAVEAQPRYRSAMAGATVQPLEGKKAEVIFDVPQRALTPGQICALYEGEVLLGGGFFEEIYYDETSSQGDGDGAVVGAHDVGEDVS
ncbi:MAG: tRNA 2-thiouridine(34) synthase MnmA [Verrucomicrobiota bacterium]